MFLVAVGWAFAVFLYLKIALQAVTYYGVTVLAASLMAIVFGILLTVLLPAYVKRAALMRVDAFFDSKPQPSLLSQTFIPMLIGMFVYVLCCRLIVFGFSGKLDREISLFNWRGLNPEFIIFVVVTSLPVLAHYITLLMGMKRLTGEPGRGEIDPGA